MRHQLTIVHHRTTVLEFDSARAAIKPSLVVDSVLLLYFSMKAGLFLFSIYIIIQGKQ